MIPEIEALRGLAIALVVLFHTNGILTFAPRGTAGMNVSLPGAFILAGHTGVSLFFLLSGFLLVPPFLREATGGERIDRKAYYRRRALRILPVYWCAVLAATILCSNGQTSRLLRGAPYLLFLNYGELPGPLWPYDGVWWSLATEVQFYLLLPLLPFLLRDGPGRRIGIAVATLYAAAYVSFVLEPCCGLTPDERKGVLVSFFGRAPLFALGAAAGWICQRWGAAIRDALAASAWTRSGACDLALLGIVALLGALLRHVVKLSFDVAELSASYWHLVEGALWAAIMLLLLLAPLRLKGMIANRPLMRLGRWSYSLYLIHYPVLWYSIFWLKGRRPDLFRGRGEIRSLTVAFVLAACVGLSGASYRLIERPFLVRKARIGDRLG